MISILPSLNLWIGDHRFSSNFSLPTCHPREGGDPVPTHIANAVHQNYI